MKCPNCQYVNREEAVFCLECGAELGVKCPGCDKPLPPQAKFCDACGCDLRKHREPEPRVPKPTPTKDAAPPKPIAGERKHVTALFSDLSGYTAMSEKLDPEEVKEITGRIFDEVSKIISKYEGFVEKFAGDAVMALFGATEAHEDDPVRAIKAAREIHKAVSSLSPQYEARIEQPLVMHTGINTGLVVTGDIDLQKGTHGVAGDTINVAARLSSLGNAGDILVGADTYYQSEGYFDFTELEPATVKGKLAPIRIYRVVAQKEQPIKLHRLHGFQAELIGRKVEIGQLTEAARKLKEGAGAVFSIYGPAGTGKSRLIQEFKDSLNLEEIQWLEGHAYPHSQNIPYAPLINLLNRSLQIEEGDQPEEIRKKVEAGLKNLIGENQDLIPYIGSLFALSYPEIEEVSPEHWREQLQKAIHTVLAALAESAPTIVCLEDLHWADPSFLDLLRLLISEFREPVLFLCAYRPIISLFTGHQINTMTISHQEIRLQDLSASESQSMVESLLKTDAIPSELHRFLQDKVEGNPFYIEEVINSLIESDTLIRDNGNWKLTKAITESEVSSTIHGVISGRLDRLEKESKRILQEASVIGRTFFYEILNRITELKHQIDQSLRSLERLDLIRARALQPDLEYIFKHALTQEVVYNGLLKKERRIIHERIGLVMEQLFKDRLPEFYETLAYHFQQGRSDLKAVDYLIKSGEKSLRRFSVEGSHKYFQRALNILTGKQDKSLDDKKLIVDLILKWAMVYYYRGDAKGWTDQFMAHKDLAEAVADPESLGMFYAWIGWSFMARDNKSGEQFLKRALDIGEREKNHKVIGYACNWLAWVCADVGRFDEAIAYGNRAQEITEFFKSDHYLFFKSLGGLAYAYYGKGDKKKVAEIAKTLLEYGQKHGNNRCLAVGYFFSGAAAVLNGAFSDLVDSCQKACMITLDPCYLYIGKTYLAMGYLMDNQIQKAEAPLKEVIEFSKHYDYSFTGIPAQAMLGVVTIAKGDMGSGLKMLEETRDKCAEIDKLPFVAFTEHILGKVFLQMVEKAEPISPLTMAKNIGFLIKNVPFADKKAQSHLNRAIQIAEKIEAKGVLGTGYLDLGLLHKAKKRKDQAKECISKAIQIFEECKAEFYLQKAKEAIKSMG
jgi:class 3 adenylate cyclase/tetratricopeptide (TPR) repeat protein